MKKLMSVLCAFSFSLLQAVGFDASTLVTLTDGSVKPIKEVVVGDNVVCYNKEFERLEGAVQGTATVTVNSTIHITTRDNITMIASSLELFFLPKEDDWVLANELKVGDCLLNDDLESIAITAIQQSSELHEMYVISVDKHQNFLASEGKYLVHNGPFAAWQAYWAVKGALYAGLGLAVTGAVVASGGAIVAAGSAVAAGTATACTIVNGAAMTALGATAGALSVGSTSAAIGVGLATGVGTMVGGAELGVAATALSTGLSSMATIAGSTAGATGVAGICGAASAAIETAAVAAFFAALTCPWTPW